MYLFVVGQMDLEMDPEFIDLQTGTCTLVTSRITFSMARES